MTDYRCIIRANLSEFRGIEKHPEIVESINIALNQIAIAGMGRLVQNFCNQRDPDQARDFLFEVWVGLMLLRNPPVRNLEYEPKQEEHPPDFRFVIDTSTFDIQVKRIHNVKNEMTKRLFERECRRRLSRLPKPWFINFWVSNEFERQHLNVFFACVKDSLDSFEPAPSVQVGIAAKQYHWEQDGRLLVRFSFLEKNSKDPGIIPGIIEVMGTETGMPEWVDMKPLRRAVRRHLRDAGKTLTRELCCGQSNLVILQAAGDVSLDFDDMDNILYGDEGVTFAENPDGTWGQRESRSPNGLFREDKFATICGLVLVQKDVTFQDDSFRGRYFVHPRHVASVEQHPEPFQRTAFQTPPGFDPVDAAPPSG